MITDKHSQTLIFWCQKSNSCSPTSNFWYKPSVLQHWAVWLIIIKFIKQNEHYKSASKTNIQSGHDPTKKHSETSLMAKVPSKINNFEGLEKVCHKFSQTFLWKRHDTPHQTSNRERSAKHRYSSNMAEHDSSHISSLTILDQAKKVKSPPSTSPLFKTFF